jgi:putative hydrolase of the HAD superfamily
VRAVLLDALGTLLWLEPPASHLRRELDARGVTVDEATAERAMRAEIAYYRAHNLEGRDGPALARLRWRCAGVLSDALGGQVPLEVVHDALLASLRFRAYPDALPALDRLRAAGLRLVVVSNWDVSLHDRLAETGIAERVDGAIASAELGMAKPDPAIFARALILAGAGADEALHVGDSLAADVDGARAAGIEPVLVLRDGAPPRDDPVRTIRSLAELPDLAA